MLLLYSVLCVVLSSIRTQLSNKLKPLANDFNFVQINVLCVQIYCDTPIGKGCDNNVDITFMMECRICT